MQIRVAYGCRKVKAPDTNLSVFSFQHRHGKHAEVDLHRERSDEGTLPRHVHQLLEGDSDGRRFVRYLRDDEADA